MKVAQRMITATAILVFGTAMYACGGGKSLADGTLLTQAQFNTLLASAAPFTAVQDGVTAVKGSVSKLTLIGTVHGSARATDAVNVAEGASAVSFGPCADMGVLVGFTPGGNNNAADPLTATYQAFKQCTGYYYEATVGSGNIAIANRIFWDGPNCTGNMYEWEAGGGGYNTQILQGGVVFLSPVDGTTELMVASGQTPQPILIQSVWVTSNPGCQADIEVQLLYVVSSNKTSVTGVPNGVGANFQLVAP